MKNQDILKFLETAYQNISTDIENGNLNPAFLEVVDILDAAIEKTEAIMKC